MQPLSFYDNQFLFLYRFGNGYVRRHIAVDVNAIDYVDVETVAVEKAMKGLQVDIMPVLLANDPLRSVIFFDSFKNKNPDLSINGVLWELEKSSNSLNLNNLKHSIDEGSKQADYLIVNVSYNITYEHMFRVVKSRFKDHVNLKVIEFRYEGKYTTFQK